MKRFSGIILLVAVLLVLTACSVGNQSDETATDSTTQLVTANVPETVTVTVIVTENNGGTAIEQNISGSVDNDNVAQKPVATEKNEISNNVPPAVQNVPGEEKTTKAPVTEKKEHTTNAGSGNISYDRAKEIALGYVSADEKNVKGYKCEYDFENGRGKYEIEFYCNGIEYDIELNASNGAIIKCEKDYEPGNNYTTQHTTQKTTQQSVSKITADEAKKIALKNAGLSENQVYELEAEYDRENGKEIYEVDFEYNGKDYEYVIDAVSGKIIYAVK